MRAEWAWTGAEVRQSFDGRRSGKEKDALFDVRRFPIRPEAA